MADDDSTVTIRFAADTAQLDAAIASVRAQLAGFNTEAANFAKQVSASAHRSGTGSKAPSKPPALRPRA
jgi:hypothetical protein